MQGEAKGCIALMQNYSSVAAICRVKSAGSHLSCTKVTTLSLQVADFFFSSDYRWDLQGGIHDAAPCSHIPAGKTLSAERKKSRRLGAILGSNGLLAVRLLRQSHLFGSGYPVGLCSNSSEQLCLSAAGSANCRSKTIRTVWLNGVDTRARSRARRRGSVAVAQWDQLHVFTAPEGVAGGHGGALPLACPYCLGSEKRTM